MDEMYTSIRPGKGEKPAIPSPDARQIRFPANAVVCLSEGELSTEDAERWTRRGRGESRRVVAVRLIIWPRGADSGQARGTDQANLPRDSSFHSVDGYLDLRGRLRSVPFAHCCQSQSLWLSRGQSLLRRTAEEREDTVHLRPACARDLRARSVSAFGDAALLVSQPAS